MDDDLVIRIAAYSPDSRGNRLERYYIRPGGPASTRVWMQTSIDVGHYLLSLLRKLGLTASMSFVEDDDEWTHFIDVAGPLSDAGEDLFDLLHTALLLKAPAPVESAMALDWYKAPDPNIEPKAWPNTEIGALINRMKYGSGNPGLRRDLASRMANVIARHPIYRTCILATVPGHDTSKVSHGEKLAFDVADLTGLPVIETKGKRPVRPQAKEGGELDLDHEFIVGDAADATNVLIVDDVCRSYRSMHGVALAAKQAGALTVHALVGARTLRN
jgi:hypothetical protein